MTVVPDVSVAVKWVLPAEGEPLRAEAMALLHRYKNAEIQLLVPEIFWVEFGNVMRKAVRAKRIRLEDAELANKELLQEDLPTVSSRVLLPGAFAIATAHGRTVYDSMYVALATRANAQLITGDERLANALMPRLPVRWLGAI
jgi:predicted nucleic acid-binding protein